MATGGATGASDHGEPFKWSESADRQVVGVAAQLDPWVFDLWREVWLS